MPDQFIQPKEEEEVKKEIKKEKKKEGFSSMGIFFGVLLAVVFGAIWERAFFDLTRLFNPLYEVCQLSNHLIFQKYCNITQYETIRLLLHISLVVPLLYILLAVSYTSMKRKIKSHSKIIFRAYFISVLSISIHLFVEFANFLFRYYRDVGNYVVLWAIALAFIAMIIFIQKRFNKPKEDHK